MNRKQKADYLFKLTAVITIATLFQMFIFPLGGLKPITIDQNILIFMAIVAGTFLGDILITE